MQLSTFSLKSRPAHIKKGKTLNNIFNQLLEEHAIDFVSWAIKNMDGVREVSKWKIQKSIRPDFGSQQDTRSKQNIKYKSLEPHFCKCSTCMDSPRDAANQSHELKLGFYLVTWFRSIAPQWVLAEMIRRWGWIQFNSITQLTGSTTYGSVATVAGGSRLAV